MLHAAAPLHEEQLRQALTGSVPVGCNRPSFTATRSGKYIFWQEDITEWCLLEELRLTQEELHDDRDIIQAETARRHNG